MGDRHDYVALEWVKGEIAETLKQARQALEAFVENPQDSTRMRFCQTYVHQVHGTLQMVEFFGAAMLSEEMEQLAQALLDGRAANQDEALQVLMQAILQLPLYLERIQVARRDLPMVVLPLLNDLRAARGEPLLSETCLFAPDLSAPAPALSPEALDQLRSAELPGVLRKLRQMLQVALVGVIREQELPTNLGYMARVFGRLQALSQDAPLQALWQIAGGVVEGLANGSLSGGSTLHNLLREVDKELKRLVEQGADGFNQPAPNELIKNLLFHVAKASPQAPLNRLLRQRYDLDAALPDAALLSEERARLAGPDREAMRSVVGALCEELVRVKDSLDLFVRGDRAQIADLQALLAPLKQIADTLAVLGFAQPRKVIADQFDVVRGLVQGDQQPGDAVLMDVAGALLYVEATLAGMVGQPDEDAGEAHHLPTTDVTQVQQVVIKEARNGLEQAKDAIIEFIASQWNHEHLARVPELLTQVRGGLAMIPLSRAAELLNACNRYIQEQLLARKAVPNWQNLDTLADAITSVEYYLERLSEDPATQGDLILDVAEESLAALGYPLSEASAAAEQPASEPQPAPLDDPLHDIDVLAAPLDEHAEERPTPGAMATDEPASADQPIAVAQDEPLTDSLPVLTEQLADVDPQPEVVSTQEALPEAAPVAQDEPAVADDSWPLDDPHPEDEPATSELPAAEEWLTLSSADDAPRDAPDSIADDHWDFAIEELQPGEALPQANEPLWTLEELETGLDLFEFEAPASELPALDDAKVERELLFEQLDGEAASQQAAELTPLPVPEQPAAEAEQTLPVVADATQAIEPPAQSALPQLLPPPADEEPMDEELLEIFVEEAGEVLATIEQYLPRWLADSDDKEALAELRRAFHTLKGSGRMIRALVIGELGWSIENLLNRVLERSVQADANVQQVVRDVTTLMPELVNEFAAKAQRQRADVDLLAAQAHALAKGQPVPKPDAPAALAAGSTDEEQAGAAELDPQLLEIFRNEVEIHLETLEHFLDDCAKQLPQPVSDDLQRALHTLKGSAYMAGILPMAEIAAPLEKQTKEYKANLLTLDLTETELLSQALALFRVGLEQLESHPLAPIPGGDEFVERLQQKHLQRLDTLESERGDEQGEVRDPQLITIFLTEGMDILLDAEALLQRWRTHPAERQELDALLDELTTLGRGADMAELPQIEELCEALLDVYGAVEEGSLAASEAFFAQAEAAHEALVDMMDEVAAGMQVSARPDLVAALRALLDDALEPNSLALLSGEHSGLDLDAATLALHQQAAAPAEAADDDVLGFFLEEAADILDSAGAALQRWLADMHNRSALSSLQRDMHTLEGGANMAGIVPVSELAHELEALYEGLADRRYQPGAILADVLPEAHEALLGMLEQLRGEQPLVPATELLASLQRLRLQPLAQPEAIPATPAAVDESRDAELVEIFLEEGFDIIDSAAAALARWMSNVDNSLELESLQRDLHTLKGGARMAEIREIGDLAHELEFLYEDLGNARLRASPALFELLQRCHDSLAHMLEALRAQHPVPHGEALIDAIRRLRGNPDEQLSVPAAVALKAVTPASGFDGEADILEIFLEEADELLDAMQAAIGRWQNEHDGDAVIDDLLRLLHTLKGGARLAGQQRLGDQSHDLEQHLSDAQTQGAPWPQSLLVDVQSAFDGLQKTLDELRQQVQQSSPVEAPERPAHVTALAAALVPSGQQLPEAAQHKVLPFVQRAAQAAEQAAARRAPQELVKVPAELLEGLVNLAGETSIFRGRVEQQVSDFGFTLGEMEATIDRVRDQLRRLDIETQAQIISRYQAEAERAGYEDFDPLEMDRHSQLQQLSRALFESASDLLDLKETLATRNRDAETLLLQQARVNTELQEGLMRTRMVPFDRLVPRLRRIVRQVAGELGKQVEFLVGNADGEMDRSVLERIVAPLEHMLRNAVDHGIESPAARLAAGKPEQGCIRLSLAREGGDIVLTLSDDGAGIDLDAVRRKAIERGLMSSGAELDEHEILQFILEAGFSTAQKVTQISGRGVGMDVVNAEVKQLGGSMDIDSQPGQGSRFRIRLPFTVSVNRALMVLSGEDLYAIPLNTIEGIVRVSPYELETYYAPDAPRFEYAGQDYELRYLGDLLNNGQQPKLVAQSLPLPVILVRSGEHAVAVQVDSLAGSREIVVKSLGPQFASVPGISGATILGDGRVVVILDLLATIRELYLQARPRPSAQIASKPADSEGERPTLVMVVDDSVTVRKVTSRLLERHGMNVLTAKDGADAIAQLQEQRPDIMLLDIEMPRMDGFEVASLVRHDDGLKNLPIIMITSRTGEKHRERAVGLGVNEYLGKPYQESQLLAAIAQWTAR